MTTATKWSMSGTYFESCDCEIACPCIFLRPPNTENGDCNVLITWSIDSGALGDTDLSGLNVVLFFSFFIHSYFCFRESFMITGCSLQRNKTWCHSALHKSG